MWSQQAGLSRVNSAQLGRADPSRQSQQKRSNADWAVYFLTLNWITEKEKNNVPFHTIDFKDQRWITEKYVLVCTHCTIRKNNLLLQHRYIHKYTEPNYILFSKHKLTQERIFYASKYSTDSRKLYFELFHCRSMAVWAASQRLRMPLFEKLGLISAKEP